LENPESLMERRGYNNWAAVAGFFDGDGNVSVDPREYILHWVVSFSDNWLPQIEQIRGFLVGCGTRVGKPRKVGSGAWMCEVAEITSLIAMATRMLESGGIYKNAANCNFYWIITPTRLQGRR